mgnify:CR=1 FL=1
MLRDAIAKAHECDVGQIFPRPSMDALLAPLLRAFVGAEDHVALAAPCHPAFPRQVLAQGARYVDVGRDRHWNLQHDALERLLDDGALRALICGRPDLPSGTMTPLSALRQALHRGLLVIVDETQLAYSDALAGLARPLNPRSRSALRLFSEEDVPTHALFVLRRIVGLAPGDMLYVYGEVESVAALWAIDPLASISAPLAAAAWLVLDHSAQVRREVIGRTTTRSELKRALSDLDGFEVANSEAASLMVRHLGTEGKRLSELLEVRGLKVASSAHPSWRDAIALSIPLAESVERVISIFQEVALELTP